MDGYMEGRQLGQVVGGGGYPEPCSSPQPFHFFRGCPQPFQRVCLSALHLPVSRSRFHFLILDGSGIESVDGATVDCEGQLVYWQPERCYFTGKQKQSQPTSLGQCIHEHYHQTYRHNFSKLSFHCLVPLVKQGFLKSSLEFFLF